MRAKKTKKHVVDRFNRRFTNIYKLYEDVIYVKAFAIAIRSQSLFKRSINTGKKANKTVSLFPFLFYFFLLSFTFKRFWRSMHLRYFSAHFVTEIFSLFFCRFNQENRSLLSLAFDIRTHTHASDWAYRRIQREMSSGASISFPCFRSFIAFRPKIFSRSRCPYLLSAFSVIIFFSPFFCYFPKSSIEEISCVEFFFSSPLRNELTKWRVVQAMRCRRPHQFLPVDFLFLFLGYAFVTAYRFIAGNNHRIKRRRISLRVSITMCRRPASFVVIVSSEVDMKFPFVVII